MKILFSIVVSLIALIILLGVNFSSLPGKPGSQGVDQCLSCHKELDGKNQAPAKSYIKDIHYQKGITCADCHGGDPTMGDMDEAMDKKKGFTGVPKPQERYKTCVKCHSDANKMKKLGSTLPTDQFEKLQNSVHFKSSSEKKGFIADCITCHGVHNIAPVKSPASKVYVTNIPNLCGSCHSNATYMKNYNPKLPIDQLEKYHTSQHGLLIQKGDTNVAECVSCHGNHDIRNVKDPKSSVYPLNIPKTCAHCHSNAEKMAKYNIPTNQYSQYTGSVHGIALLIKQDLSAPACNSCHGNHGAMPPGIQSISNVCGNCHNLNGEMFAKSPHAEAFDRDKIPQCEICHGNHGIQPATDEMVGISGNATCIKCHKNSPDDKGYIAAKQMRLLLDSLVAEEARANKLLADAGNLGMDVSDAMFAIKDVRQSLIEARTVLHQSDLELFKESIDKGFEINTKSINAGRGAIDDYYFRRKGLGIATVIVTILAIGIYLKVRKIEKKDKSD